MQLRMRLTRGAHVVLPLVLWVAVAAMACGGDRVRSTTPVAGQEPPLAIRFGAGPELNGEGPRIVVLGDSLTGGLGLAPEEAFPARLQAVLREAGYPHEIVNAGVSGDTTGGGLRRLEWSLDGDVRVLVVALGANDGLRGLAVAEMKVNLAEIIRGAQARGVRVLLTGMEAPPNLGLAYTTEFRDAFRELADVYDVAFVPFLLNGVAGHAELNQSDGIHPNNKGAAMVADLVWSILESVLEEDATS